jgi:hypothetical protein
MTWVHERIDQNQWSVLLKKINGAAGGSLRCCARVRLWHHAGRSKGRRGCGGTVGTHRQVIRV